MKLPVRKTDPDTSHEAAAKAVTQRATIRAHILESLAVGPKTHDQVISWFHRSGYSGSPSGIRTRMAELVTDGEVERVAGQDAKSRMGNRSALWQLVTKKNFGPYGDQEEIPFE